MNRYPGEFVPAANAHALEEACRPIVEEMIRQGGAKAIAVASSYGDGADRVFLDSPKAEWPWEFAAVNDIVVHIHPPMQSIGHESLMQYRLDRRCLRNRRNRTDHGDSHCTLAPRCRDQTGGSHA